MSGGDARVARVIARFWAQLQGTGGKGAMPDATDNELASYLDKHKIGVMNDGGEGGEMAAGRSIIERLGEDLTKAWKVYDEKDEGEAGRDVARGRVRGLAQAIAVMRAAPGRVTREMIEGVEGEFRG